MKRFGVWFVVVMILIGVAIFAANEILLSSPMSQVIANDPRNSGVDVSVHFGCFVDPRVLVYDIQGVSGDKSEADVFRVFLQFAHEVQATKFEEVDLACKGHTKFIIHGSYFRQLGHDYSWQNPVYTDRTFPENVFNPDGSPAYAAVEGGFLGVDLEEIQDFNDLHARWWKSELAADQ